MASDASRVIVTPGTTSQAATVHHRDFPEIRSQGETPRAAAEHLLNQLARALDTALTDWRRDTIQQAIADVKAFVESGDRA